MRPTLDRGAQSSREPCARRSTARDADDLEDQPVAPRSAVRFDVAGEIEVVVRRRGCDGVRESSGTARKRAGRAESATHYDVRGEENEPESNAAEIRVG